MIDNVPKEKLKHLKAIYFTRCTAKNVDKICSHLEDPTFSSYNLCKKDLTLKALDMIC